jgi:transcriptional regulator with XRE-family HTH domain
MWDDGIPLFPPPEPVSRGLFPAAIWQTYHKLVETVFLGYNIKTMNPVNKRIKELRTILQISQRQFAKQIFISQSSYGEIETGTRNVNGRILQLICSQFNVNKEWITNGAGEMFNSQKPDINLEHLIEIYKLLSKPLQDYLLEQSESLLKLHNENTITKKTITRTKEQLVI